MASVEEDLDGGNGPTNGDGAAVERRRQRSRRGADLIPRDVHDRMTAGVVVVTGICGRLGRRVARFLHRERAVVGLDRRPFTDRPKDIEHYQIDLRRKKVKEVFRNRQVSALVHLGVSDNEAAE